ncbi:hypothetical protein HUJ04_003673 [Dendroctonus ponderosae]|nr:hypothetical protein HUJ04_003673 [Dendroctonus ponderosae]KAH1010393.1 hypothetical protein HUJ05_004696 [Dendroctonus ponderosae]
MRRQSPHRSVRRRSLSKRRRFSLSPLSRNQPAPPGEERNRKSIGWDGSKGGKRFRSRSRSVEWVGGELGRVSPFAGMGDQGRARSRDYSRDKYVRSREFDKPRERAHLKESKHHHRRRSSQDPLLSHVEGYEESYLDLHETQGFGNNSSIHKKHEGKLILDPSSISFNTFTPDLRSTLKSQDKLPDVARGKESESTRGHLKVRGFQQHAATPARQEPMHLKEAEAAADRINRLEKLVEKLVEKGNTNSSTSKDSKRSKNKIFELIPSSTKFTTSMWLNCIHEECLLRNYEEKSSINFLQDQMTGIMKAWFKSVASYDFTWPELRMLITKTFPDNVDFAHTLKLLVTRDKSVEETVTQYYFSKLYLCEACKITGENAVSCLIDGLNNPFVKQDIKARKFLTPEVLYADYLSKIPESEFSVHADHREVVAEYPRESYAESLTMDDIQEQKVDSVSSHSNKYREKKCYTCNRIGHLGKDCRHAPICYNCNQKGHIAAKCLYKKNNLTH